MLRVMRLLAMLALGSAAVAGAEQPPAELPDPTGEVVLTVLGPLGVTNVDETAQFDIEMLRALPQAELVTGTPWTARPQEFRGVPLLDLLQRLGVTSGTVVVHAINDFIGTVPLDDPRNAKALVAYEIDGTEIPIRGKGPLWLIYPFDSDTRLQTEVIYARSVWQLYRIELIPAEPEVIQ